MTNRNLFSIIIPTYNRADDLQRCLISLVNQTFKNFEVLVCDDGSTDHTKEIAGKFEGKLSLKYFYIENTGGPAGPRNVGLQHATSDWVCFLDSDDWYDERRLEILSNMDLTKFDFLYHNLKVVQNGKITRTITSRNLSKKDAYFDLLFNLNAIPTSSTCIRKKFLVNAKGFSERKEIVGLEDFDLWIRVAKLNARFMYLPRDLGFYFIGTDNLTLHDERQIGRFKSLYENFINQESNVFFKYKINAALNYQIGWILVNKSDCLDAYLPLFNSFIFGSIPIKLRSINMFLKSFIKLNN